MFAAGGQIPKLLGTFIESDAFDRVHAIEHPLTAALHGGFDQVFRLLQASSRRPDRHISAAGLLVDRIRHRDRMPECEAELPATVVNVRVGIDIELKPPVLAEHEQELVEVGRVIVLDDEDLPHPVRRVDAIECRFIPGPGDLLQSMTIQDLQDRVPHVHLALDRDRLPGIQENVEKRFVRGRSHPDRNLFEEYGLEFPPGGDEVIDEYRLDRDVGVDRSVRIDGSDLDDREDLTREEPQELPEDHLQPLMADRDLECIGIGGLVLSGNELADPALPRGRSIQAFDAEGQGVAVHHHAIQIISQSELPHRHDSRRSRGPGEAAERSGSGYIPQEGHPVPISTPGDLNGMSDRTHWGSRTGFILAAAGSAVGLGNVWKFPYITGENGGGLFVLIYLVCIAGVGIPILLAEVILGKSTQKSAVPAFRERSGPASPWMTFGWMGVVAAFVLLSYYAVIAGWTMQYAIAAIRGTFAGMSNDDVQAYFGNVASSPSINVGWMLAFMVFTIGIVAGGVKRGIETASKIMIPALGIMLIALAIRAAMVGEGFGQAVDFVFGFHADELSAGGVLEALGHSFFTLSIGMGTMVAYGSYLRRKDDAVTTGIVIGGVDTLIALVACLVLFPITFASGFDPAAGPGLVFQNMPIALMALPGGTFWATIFFILLFFAALTSAISLLEVAASYFIDEKGVPRFVATVGCGFAIILFALPSALSNGSALGGLFNQGVADITGRNWFDSADWLVSNLMLPIGGLGVALFMGWKVTEQARQEGFMEGARLRNLYVAWLLLLRWVAPAAVLLVFLQAIGILDVDTLFAESPSTDPVSGELPVASPDAEGT